MTYEEVHPTVRYLTTAVTNVQTGLALCVKQYIRADSVLEP